MTIEKLFEALPHKKLSQKMSMKLIRGLYCLTGAGFHPLTAEPIHNIDRIYGTNKNISEIMCVNIFNVKCVSVFVCDLSKCFSFCQNLETIN